jgi:predicted phage terminase large subunit-like protein
VPATAPNLSEADWLAIEREYCARSLSNFVRAAWPVYDPTSPLVYGWHIDAICEHLEAITRGEITRLLINIPPGCMKSSLTNVLWPCWEWGPLGKPHHRIISAAHEQGLAIRDNRAMRRVVQSDWFQRLWPLDIASDQNQKTYFENGSLGFRQACAVSSMTGKRGHRVLWDDPLSAEDADSDAKRETVLREFQETLPSRYVDQRTSANVIVMQRLHQNDPAGFILEHDLGYEHLMLPMEYERDRKCYTSIGFEDLRTEEGELLFPERFPAYTLERDKSIMTEYAVAGQFQQRPSPRGGGMFPVDRFEIVEHKPQKSQIAASIRFWDKAGTSGGGAYTAGVLVHRLKDGRYLVEDVQRGQWGALDREQKIRSTAEVDGNGVTVWVEQEPGSGGKESAESTIRNLSGFRAFADRVTGDKETRAEPYAAQVQGGNVLLLRASWNRDFIQEHEVFPSGTYKDQVDAAAGAFAKLAQKAPNLGSWL